jgi:hypothetical protein
VAEEKLILIVTVLSAWQEVVGCCSHLFVDADSLEKVDDQMDSADVEHRQDSDLRIDEPKKYWDHCIRVQSTVGLATALAADTAE